MVRPTPAVAASNGIAAGLQPAFLAPPAKSDPLRRIMATIATDPADSGTVECPTCKGQLSWRR
ncbi:hypothetical protein MKK69_20935, partial [Methylobacterium sp. J-026]|nr:hypothetical protein [Methylobacterium sp. J-026]